MALRDKDRIFASLYGYQNRRLEAVQARGVRGGSRMDCVKTGQLQADRRTTTGMRSLTVLMQHQRAFGFDRGAVW